MTNWTTIRKLGGVVSKHWRERSIACMVALAMILEAHVRLVQGYLVFFCSAIVLDEALVVMAFHGHIIWRSLRSIDAVWVAAQVWWISSHPVLVSCTGAYCETYICTCIWHTCKNPAAAMRTLRTIKCRKHLKTTDLAFCYINVLRSYISSVSYSS